MVGGPVGVVCAHNLTAHPGYMRGIAERFAGAGYTVDVPLLSGHGRDLEAILPYRFDDFRGDVAAAVERVRRRASQVVVVGAGAGGVCAMSLAGELPDLAALAVISSPTGPLDAGLVAKVEELARRRESADGEVERRADDDVPTAVDLSGTPERAALSMHEVLLELDLSAVTCPTLGFYTKRDTTLLDAWAHAERLAREAPGPVELVELTGSSHMATVGEDAALIEDRVFEFVRRTVG